MEPNQGNLEPKPKSYSEIADIVFPNPIGLPCPDYATLLFSRILYHFSNLNTHTQNTRNYNKIKFNNHPLYSNLLCLNLIKVYIPPRSLLLFSSQINSTTPSFHANPPLFQVTMFIVYPHLIS